MELICTSEFLKRESKLREPLSTSQFKPPPPPCRARVADGGGIHTLLNKNVAQGVGSLTIIEPQPRQVEANVGDLTCNEQL